jgi:hypothetical protein
VAWVTWAKVTVVAVLHMPLRVPLEALYRAAPSSIGGWDGRANHEICASITGVKAEFWASDSSAHECGQLISQHFDSRYTVVLCVLYFYIAWKLVRCLQRVLQQKIYGIEKQQTVVYVLPPWVDGRLVRAPRAHSSTL